jgi:hypothetical protein
MAKFEKVPGWAIVKDSDIQIAKGGFIGLLSERGLL